MQNHYLDATPMICALQQRPSEFERRGDYLCHRPSRHWLAFDKNGRGRLIARCSCAQYPISVEQSAALQQAADDWEKTYWRPLVVSEAAARRFAEINREFARHFSPKPRWRRAIDAVLAWSGIGPAGPYFHIDPLLPEDFPFRGVLLR
jgi:hypothetical protein